MSRLGPVLRLACFWFFLGGGGGGPISPCPAWGCVPPLGRACAARAGGVGGGLCFCLRPSLSLPWAGNKAAVIGIAPAMEGVAPILLRFLFACRPRAWSVWRRCASALVRVPVAAPVRAGGPGVETRGFWALLCPLLGRCDPQGGRGDAPPPLGGAARGPRPGPPFFAGSFPPCMLVRPGLCGSPRRRARPAVSGSAQRGGGGGGGLCAALPGGVAGGPSGAGGCLTLVRLPAFPGQATERVPFASLWVRRAWPPYRSGSCSRGVPGCDPCAVLARRRGFARPLQPSWEQAVGGVGARGMRAQLCPSPGRRGAFGGKGDVPSAEGGWRAGQPEGGVGGEGRGDRTVVPHLPSPGGQSVVLGSGPLYRRRIPLGYTCSARAVGQPRAPGAAWPAVGGSAWRGGGGRPVRRPPRGLRRGLFPRRPLHTAFAGAAVPPRSTGRP